MAKAPVIEKWLIFVDTNIMLDFYRLPGESAERQIASLQNHLNSVIVTEQVKMEFLKHRQKVISDSISKMPKPQKSQFPMIVTGTQPASTFTKRIDEAVTAHKKLQEKVGNILKDPSKHDPVFKGLKRLFANKCDWNLARPNPLRFRIRSLARKRFSLGYPPRKSDDTSIGDALNWEWIIHCAQVSKENHNILIVSRDGDYGLNHNGVMILNDWLREEFSKRVSQRRKIVLTNKLSDALRKLDEVVVVEDEKAEDGLINSDKSYINERIAEIFKNINSTSDLYIKNKDYYDILKDMSIRDLRIV